MNMKFKIKYLIILFFFILSSCWREDDLFRNKSENFIGDNLRIDGFYYSYYQGKINNVVFFYRNGVSFNIIGDGQDRTKPEEIQTLLRDVERMERYKTYKDLWGIFLVHGNNILIEKWTFAGLGWKTTVIESGTILNDTSFEITKRDDFRAGSKEVYYEYFFYPYSPKPDSTNVFIK